MVLTWTLSDGTTVDSHGRVTGGSPCAKWLRWEASRALAGEDVNSHWGAIPSEKSLVFGQHHLVDSWVRWLAELYGLTVTEAPDIEYPEVTPEDPPELEPGMMFVY